MKDFKLKVFYNEVKEELSKVNWPTKEQTMGTTMVVLVVIGIITVYLGIIDAVFVRLASLIMG